MHGARSPQRVAPLADRLARRFTRQRGITAAQFSPIGRKLLRNWSRAAAALELLDAHAAEVGLLKSDGEPHGFMALYVKLLNSERHALRALEQHVNASDDPAQRLNDYLEAKYRVVESA